MDRYEILESISQAKDRTLSETNSELARVAYDIRRATQCHRTDETQHGVGREDVTTLNEREKRAAEVWAKERNMWTEMPDIFSFGVPGPSGSESDTYLSSDGYIYKTNNLMHCGDSIIKALTKFIMYNTVFIDSAYTFIGFTGFSGRSVYPIVRQPYIRDAMPATRVEIDYFMAALDFSPIGDGAYEDGFFIVKDILPKNVLKIKEGDLYVIDAEILLKKQP